MLPNVSAVIPTIGDQRPITCASIPNNVETVVVREGNRSEARNIGADRATNDILVFCDDDIRFDPSFFWHQTKRLEGNEVRGLKDYGLGYILTRFMVIHKDDFDHIGGFDERLDHMEDTEFAIRAERSGMDITRLSRYQVFHEDHDNDITTRKRAKALAYLTLKHRTEMAGPLRRLV